MLGIILIVLQGLAERSVHVIVIAHLVPRPVPRSPETCAPWRLQLGCLQSIWALRAQHTWEAREQIDQHLSIVVFLGSSEGDWTVATLKSPKGTVWLFLALLSRCCWIWH